MLTADIIFNILVLGLDAIGLLWLWRLQFRKETAIQIMILAFSSVSVVAAALIIQHAFGYRHFATLRFLGMAVFWHLPAVLIVLSKLYRMRILTLPAVLLACTYVYSYFLEPKNLQVTRYHFSSPLLHGLQRPIVMAQVSDVQAEEVSSYEEEVFETLSDLKPDLTVYTGDYLHVEDREKYVHQAAKLNVLLKGMTWRPPFGSYAVLGDSDIHDLWTDVFEGAPVKLLSNQTVVLRLPGTRALLVGLTPNTSRSRTGLMLRSAVGKPDGHDLSIYVGHSPDFVQAVAEDNATFLVLAGHTHGGQVQLPFVGPLITLSRLPRKYADYYGPYGKGVLSVSRGIGMERYDAPRLRFLCPPEIRLVILQSPTAVTQASRANTH
jgi:uncharacterized protein